MGNGPASWLVEGGLLRVGDQVQYYNRAQGRWIPGSVLSVNPTGEVALTCTDGGWIPLKEQAHVVRRVGSNSPSTTVHATAAALSQPQPLPMPGDKSSLRPEVGFGSNSPHKSSPLHSKVIMAEDIPETREHMSFGIFGSIEDISAMSKGHQRGSESIAAVGGSVSPGAKTDGSETSCSPCRESNICNISDDSRLHASGEGSPKRGHYGNTPRTTLSPRTGDVGASRGHFGNTPRTPLSARKLDVGASFSTIVGEHHPISPSATGPGSPSNITTKLVNDRFASGAMGSGVKHGQYASFDSMATGHSFSSVIVEAPGVDSFASLAYFSQRDMVNFDPGVEVVAFKQNCRPAQLNSHGRTYECNLESKVQVPSSWSFATSMSTLSSFALPPARHCAGISPTELSAIDEGPSQMSSELIPEQRAIAAAAVRKDTFSMRRVPDAVDVDPPPRAQARVSRPLWAC